MKTELRTPFFDALLTQHPQWCHISLCPAQSDPRSGVMLIVPAPSGSDLSGGLVIEDDGGEITIGLDYSHIHLAWPPYPQNALDPIWCDPLAFVDAVLVESVVASSGWIDGELSVGSLHHATNVPDLIMHNVQYLRVRSWLGTRNREQFLVGKGA